MYNAITTREHRTAFILLCDSSGSMTEEILFQDAVIPKSEAVSLIINMLIDELINRSRREEGIRDYFDIAVLEYSGEGIRSLLSPDGKFTTASELNRRAVTTRKRHVVRTLPGGNQIAALLEQRQWITAKAFGDTPMGAALAEAEKLVNAWCAVPQNQNSYPPLVINITDGEASDAGSAELVATADRIKAITTRDGNVLLFNIHIETTSGSELTKMSFPDADTELPPLKYASLLHRMSSELPACYNDLIAGVHPNATPPFRAVGYNCQLEELFSMLSIGTISSSFAL